LAVLLLSCAAVAFAVIACLLSTAAVIAVLVVSSHQVLLSVFKVKK